MSDFVRAGNSCASTSCARFASPDLIRPGQTGRWCIWFEFWCGGFGSSRHADLSLERIPRRHVAGSQAMISIQPLRGGAAVGYYVEGSGCEHETLQQLTLDPEGKPLIAGQGVDYYVNDHDLSCSWLGGGAAALGLNGTLKAEDAAVLEGLLDGSFRGTRIGAPLVRFRDGVRVDARRAGFDVTLSVPKSVSVLMAIGSPDVAKEVLSAHEGAVTQAMGLLEALSARAARGHHGDGKRVPRIQTSGFVGAAFTHTTSRARDPQLHSHVVIANLAQGLDGRWSALDSRTLHREATTASYVYQHVLRQELSARLGVEWTDVKRGVAEVDGISKQVQREFSTRRRQIETALEQQLVPYRTAHKSRARHLAARAACLATRPRKTHADAGEMQQRWLDRAGGKGLTPELIEREVLHRRETAPATDLHAIARMLLAADGVTRESATFGQGTVVKELISHIPAGAAVSTGELLTLAAELVHGHEQVVPVITPDGPAYTTRDMLTTEHEALALATRANTPLAALDRAVAAKAIGYDGATLRQEQQRAAYALLTSGLPVQAVAGPAGCGKTAGLAVATRTWTAAGIPVAGTAVAALTAQGLEQASGARSVSLARLLNDPDRHLPIRGVLLVDEAGMVGTRQLHRLLTLAEQRTCKLVLVGDPAQLPELEAGGLFARLTEQESAIVLDGHHRQQHDWERDALAALRIGDTTTALDAYRQHGRLHTAHSTEELHPAAVQAYLTARAQLADPWQAVLLASSHDQVRDLNGQVRQRLLGTGQLGPDALAVDTDDGPVSYRIGDQVVVTRNDHARGLLNGTTATVTDIGKDGLTMTTSHGADVTVANSWLAEGRLDHGYAMTLHKAQGRTVHTALVVGDSSMSNQAGYVGMSRGTDANHLYLAESDVGQLTRDCAGRVHYLRPERGDRRTALSRDKRQRLAIEHVPRSRASGLER